MAPLLDFIKQQERILAELCAVAPWSEESLHDYRVSLRRLQVTLPLLDLQMPEHTLLRRTLHRQLKSSNRSRDSAILCAQLQRLRAPESLLARASEERSKEKAVSRTQLKGLVEAISSGCRRWEALLCAEADFPLPATAARSLLGLQYGLYLQGVAQRVASINTPQRAMQARRWHRLRVAIKRLRYLLEWLASQEAQWRSQLQLLKGWQEQLGELSDLAMVEQWLRRRRHGRGKGATLLLQQLQPLQQAKQQQAFAQLPTLTQFLLDAQPLSPILADPANPS